MDEQAGQAAGSPLGGWNPFSYGRLRFWARLAGLVCVAFACAHLLGHFNIPVFETADRYLQDRRARSNASLAVEDVVIVDIDERSLAEIGRWTWPRRTLAELFTRIVDDGNASVLAVDMVFAEASVDVRDDRVLAEAMRARPIVLGYYFSSDEGGRRIGALPSPVFTAEALQELPLEPLQWDGYGANVPSLTQAAIASGFFNAKVDEDGIVRSIPLLVQHDRQLYESLSLATLRMVLGGAVLKLGPDALTLRSRRSRGPASFHIPINWDLTAQVPFSASAGPVGGRFRYYAAVDVLRGAIPPDALSGRIVLLGSSAQGIGDRRATPVNRSLPGVEVHATLIAGVLHDELVSRPQKGGLLMAVLTAVFGALAALTFPRLSAPALGLASGLGGVAVLGVGLIALNQWNWILPLTPSLAALLCIAMINFIVGYLVESRARRAVIDLFGQYLSPALVAKIARRPQDYPIESQNRRLTILFADVRGFTRIAESMEPQALREYLNRFLTRMTEEVHRQNGTVDKYMGDAIMAFWGAPIDDPRQEDHAVAAACEMQKAVAELNRDFAERGWPTLAIGVGINTGTARVGDMGSQLRRTYTAIGDAVNLAARLETLTKKYALPILVGEATARGVTNIPLDSLGETEVQGRTERVRVFCPRVFRAQAKAAVTAAVEADPKLVTVDLNAVAASVNATSVNGAAVNGANVNAAAADVNSFAADAHAVAAGSNSNTVSVGATGVPHVEGQRVLPHHAESHQTSRNDRAHLNADPIVVDGQARDTRETDGHSLDGSAPGARGSDGSGSERRAAGDRLVHVLRTGGTKPPGNGAPHRPTMPVGQMLRKAQAEREQRAAAEKAAAAQRLADAQAQASAQAQPRAQAQGQQQGQAPGPGQEPGQGPGPGPGPGRGSGQAEAAAHSKLDIDPDRKPTGVDR